MKESNIQVKRSLIVDDEPKSVELLEALLEDYCPHVEVVGTASDVRSAVQAIREAKPDLVFLDIAMPDGDGFRVLEVVGERNFEVIFTTAYEQYAVRAFEFSALHYLLKPIDIVALTDAVSRLNQPQVEQRLANRVELLFDNLHQEAERIALAHQHGFDLVNIADIVYLSGEGNYTSVHLRQGKTVLVSKQLGHYATLLERHGFFRIHKKHVVNLASVEGFHRGKNPHLTLIGGQQLQLSYRRKDEFLLRLSEHVSF